MNKTRKRAIQKHRAKEAKYELRRKEGGDQNGAKLRTAGASAPQASRPRSTSRRPAGGEPGE